MIDGLTTSVAVKAPCAVATVGPITLAGFQTVNGVVLTETTPPTRVLVMFQADDKDNGIYDAVSGAWPRALDFNGARDAVTGTLVLVNAPADPPVFFRLTTANPVIFGTSDITFEGGDIQSQINVLSAAVDDLGDEVDGLQTEVTANNAAAVHIAGTESVTGSKTFAGGLKSSTTATVPTDVVTKAVTDALALGIAAGGTNHTYASVAAAQADSGLANASYYNVIPSAYGGAYDIYIKNSSSSSTYQSTVESVDGVTTLIAASAPMLPNIAYGGDLYGGIGTWLSVYIAGVATTDSFFTSRNCFWTTAQANGVESIFVVPLAPDHNVQDGDWVAVSVLLKSSVANTFPTGSNLYAAAVMPDASTCAFDLVDFDAIDSTHRVYTAVFQIQGTTPFLNAQSIIFNITNTAGGGSTLNATGFAVGVSAQKPGAVDSLNFPLPAAPDLLFPAALNLVNGDALDIYVAGMTAERDQTPYDFTVAGSSTTGHPFMPVSNRTISLDGSKVRGAATVLGYLRGKASNIWYNTLYQAAIISKALTLYSVAATGVGTPVMNLIGDSLIYQGWQDPLNTRLVAAGITPSWIGTFYSTGGLLGEGRPSWRSDCYTYNKTAINADGTAVIMPVREGGGVAPTMHAVLSGGTTGNITSIVIDTPGSGLTDAAAIPLYIVGTGTITAFITGVISGGALTAINAFTDTSAFSAVPTVALPPTVTEYLAMAHGLFPRLLFNPYIRPSTGGDPGGSIFNGYIFDYAHYLSRFSFAAPTIVMIGLGTNDVRDASVLGSGAAAAAVAEVSGAIPIIYASVRAAAPSAHVGFVLNGLVPITTWKIMVEVIRWFLLTYDNKHVSAKTWLLPCYAVQHWLLGYPLTFWANNGVGTQNVNVNGDDTHGSPIGFAQMAEVMYRFVMNHL